jgi:catalase
MDFVSISSPVFFVRTPEDFLEFTRARKPDPGTGQPDMERLGAFLGAHPEAQPAIQHTLATPPPSSYLRCAYNGIHAFRWTAGDGTASWVRYRWEPAEGEETLSDEEAGDQEADYLQRDLGQRLERGPGRFTLLVKLAQEGDSLEDPTAAWPDDRQVVAAGEVEVTGLAFDRERDGDVLVFDPLRLPDGIEPSDDPILHARPGAYAESVLRRSGVAR